MILVFLGLVVSSSRALLVPSRLLSVQVRDIRSKIECVPLLKKPPRKALMKASSDSSQEDVKKKKQGFLGMSRTEARKVIPLAIIFFMVLFNYTILRDTKDVLVITAPKSGAEIIPFLKTYVNLPGAILFTLLFTALSNRYSQPQLFRGIVSSFLAFFGLFATVLYPARDFLHPNALCDSLATMLPLSFAAPIAVIRNWTFSLFYMCAELWGSVVASLLFWSLANSVMSVEEAKKYYPFFGLFANIALVFSGQFIKQVAMYRAAQSAVADPWASSLKMLIGGVTVAGTILLAGHEWLQRRILNDPTAVDPERIQQTRKKTTMSVGESVSTLAKSSYIRNLATLVISYGLAINIVEVTWKSKLKQQFPDPSSYAAFMGNFSSATGVVTFFSMLIGRFILKRTKWVFAASIPPLTLAATGVLFFSLNLLPSAWAPLAGMLGLTPLVLAVLAGAAQNIASKATKYSLFDPCKEIAYISMEDAEQRTKGKAAVDVIGGPFGKSFGSILQQTLILSLGSLAASTPYLGIILLLVILNWVRAVRDLGPQISEKQLKYNLAHQTPTSTNDSTGTSGGKSSPL